MEEKKLTDEEIINALDKTKQELANISPEDDDYDKLLTVKTIVEYCHDLIHRLKNENDSIKKDYIELDLECRELRTEVDTKQCIITLLAKDFDDRDKQLKSKVEEVYADFMKDYKIMREELNGVYDELGEEIFAHEEFTKKAQEEIERLTKELEKVHEIERANIRAEIADAGTSCHWCERQTVKDTAKEIYLWLKEHTFDGAGWAIVKAYFREKGVEVE